MSFDYTKPFRARDSRPVVIWGHRWGILWGAVRSGQGDHTVTGWDERTGLRVDTVGPDGADLVNVEPVYADEQIEHWGNVFQAHRLHELGIRFDVFLSCPREILEAVARTHTADRLAAYPSADLLPTQRAIADALERELVPACAHMRGGAYIEPLRHHSFAVTRHVRERRITS